MSTTTVERVLTPTTDEQEKALSAAQSDWLKTAHKIDNKPDMLLALERASALTYSDHQREANTAEQASLRERLGRLERAQRDHSDFLVRVVREASRVRISARETARVLSVNVTTVTRYRMADEILAAAKKHNLDVSPATARKVALNRPAKDVRADLAAAVKSGHVPEDWATAKRASRPATGAAESPAVLGATELLDAVKHAAAVAKTYAHGTDTPTAAQYAEVRRMFGALSGALDTVGRRVVKAER
jgi:hypothetical protein